MCHLILYTYMLTILTRQFSCRVIALHLHGSISMIGKKIAERRNLHRIQREIDRKVAFVLFYDMIALQTHVLI